MAQEELMILSGNDLSRYMARVQSARLCGLGLSQTNRATSNDYNLVGGGTAERMRSTFKAKLSLPLKFSGSTHS